MKNVNHRRVNSYGKYKMVPNVHRGRKMAKAERTDPYLIHNGIKIVMNEIIQVLNRSMRNVYALSSFRNVWTALKIASFEMILTLKSS